MARTQSKSFRSTELFLPTSREDLKRRGWDEIDILLVSGDAYVDHPSFGPVLIARCLEAQGYRVGLIAQPRWTDLEDLQRLGRPRLFVGVSAGNLDSMLSKLTAQRKVRAEEQYSPRGQPNLRPNRATIVYANLCRQAFPGVPIILGGIEASLRRTAHYDYWADEVRRSLLLDAKADLLVFGMAERTIVQVAGLLREKRALSELRYLRGSCCVLDRESWQRLLQEQLPPSQQPVVLPSFEEVQSDPRAFALMTRLTYEESNPFNARALLQVHGTQAVWIGPPAHPLSRAEFDELYDLPFQRRAHPSYGQPIPALRSVQHSLVTSRGCFGGCAFCSISCHEGRWVQSRSQESVLREAKRLQGIDGFSGVVTDVGGPTANVYGLGCTNARAAELCRRQSCLHPSICRHLRTETSEYLALLRAVRKLPGIRNVFVASGLRYDLALRSPPLVREIAAHHTGGQLSVAPEHCSKSVLDLMRKPSLEHFERFVKLFRQESDRAGKKQFLVPYFIVGHPGSTLEDTIELALYLKRQGWRPRQVQEFIPTPMTLATAMYHTGLDPFTLRPVPVVRSLRIKRLMKALLFYWSEEHWPLAREALRLAGRADLVGSGKDCLVPEGRGAKRQSDHRSSKTRKRTTA